MEYVSDMFDGNEVYTLLDEQKVAYENIITLATTSAGKKTIIVNGGPGTGKSVVAMNAFVKLLKLGKNLKFVAPNASFKIRKGLKPGCWPVLPGPGHLKRKETLMLK